LAVGLLQTFGMPDPWAIHPTFYICNMRKHEFPELYYLLYPTEDVALEDVDNIRGDIGFEAGYQLGSEAYEYYERAEERYVLYTAGKIEGVVGEKGRRTWKWRLSSGG